MRRAISVIAFVVMGVLQCYAEMPKACIGNAAVSKFHLMVEPAKGGPPLPLNAVNVVEAGQKLKYEPLHSSPEPNGKAKIAVLLVPAPEEPSKEITVLEAKPAKAAADWQVPLRASVVGVVFGPRGLDVKKVSSLVEKNRDLIPQLADYAQETATVEALVQTLTQYEQAPPGSRDLDAALQGFSAQYGVSLPRLDTTAPTSQQAALLLRAVLPPLSTYDPLAAQRSALVQQSAGLAASVASLFFGSPVILAAGGASLFENMRTLMFPDTDLRTAFALPLESKGIQLCTKNQPPKSRARAAFLWMLRIPDVGPPSVSLAQPARLPLGWKSTIKVACANLAQLRTLPRARDWRLVSGDHEASLPMTVAVGSQDDSLTLDLSQTKIPAGRYQLAAKWDWEPVKVDGSIDLHPFENFSSLKIAADSADRLIAGSGFVEIQLTGADFEFVRKLTLSGTGRRKAPPTELPFTLPKGDVDGELHNMQTEIDTTSLPAGSYLLTLTQTNGATHDVPISVHPTNPKIENLPLRANLGETEQAILLRGSGLERIEHVMTSGASLNLAPVSPGSRDLTERKASIKLLPGARKGERLSLNMLVAGIQSALQIPNAIEVVGPRPKIVSVKISFAQEVDVALHDGEIPAGSGMSLAIHIQNIDSRPEIELACSSPSDTIQKLALHPGERNGSAALDFAGEDVLFLSLFPGAVGQSGCLLTLTVISEPTGASDPYLLGRIIRFPRIEKFILTDQKLGESLYAGTLMGQDLQMIEKTGWSARTGYPVQGMPVPVSADPQEQTLKIQLPWPSPAPHAPLFIWLRGENEARMTKARY